MLVGTHGLREGGTLRIVICQISPSTIKPDNHLLVSQLYETAILTRSICLVSLLSWTITQAPLARTGLRGLPAPVNFWAYIYNTNRGVVGVGSVGAREPPDF